MSRPAAEYEQTQLRVLHLDHSQEAGGAELALRRLVLSSDGWAPEICLPGRNRGNSCSNSDVFADLPEVVRAGPHQPAGASQAGNGGASRLAFVARIISASVAIRRTRQFRSADVVHFNTSRAAVYGTIATRVLGRKPSVLALRDFVTPEALGSAGFEAMTRFVIPQATAIIANSKSTLASAEEYIRTPLVQIIQSPSGLSANTIERPTKTRVRTVAMVARLDAWKGQDLLVRAFAQVFRGTDVRLLLAGAAAFGHEAYEQQLRSQISELALENQVSLLGHVENVPKLLADVDIAVQCSIRPEPLGQNVLQYLAAGIPTVAADVGGPAEWITDGFNGLLFRQGDSADLERALASLASSQRLRSELRLPR